MRVTCDALAVEKPIWMLGDSAYDTLGWHDHLLAAGVVPVAPYNARNTDDPKDIEYRVEARIDEHSEDVQLKQSTLDETYNRRVESNEPTTPSRTAASGTFAPEAASTHEHKCSSRCAFVSLLRSPTTNAETIQEAPSSRYENYSMTPSAKTNHENEDVGHRRDARHLSDEEDDPEQGRKQEVVVSADTLWLRFLGIEVLVQRSSAVVGSTSPLVWLYSMTPASSIFGR